MYKDRLEAGKTLSRALKEIVSGRNPLVLAIPRGGVLVARQIAHDLNLELDIVMAKKIGAPENPEYAVAAVDPDGKITQSQYLPGHVLSAYIQKQAESVKKELARRMNQLRGERPYPALCGRDAILVDDGLATGLTAASAAQFLKRHGVRTLILAVPVASQEAIRDLTPLCDHVVAPLVPEYFYAVGQWYHDFGQVSDEEVLAILHNSPNL